ncbi:hypothetical protein [Leyella stercorea]|jgi:hypothetical protein|uniref:hypothetical protein n=1 Tax=Leyella stercorea TaxID=363265 RepID=UPI00241EF7B3|nr:hypothetical protein [Leyella stercorea]
MTRKLILFIMALCMTMMTSCKKDYNALFGEHMAELNKEGKFILCQKNDSAEHYIVYMDVDKIMVDTLGDSPKEYPLGKLNVHEYKATIQEGKFCLKSFEAPSFTIKIDTLKKEMTVSVEGQEGWFVTTKFSDIKANRDYLTFGFDAFNEDTRSVYLFLNEKLDVYVFEPYDGIEEKEKGINLSIFRPGTEFWNTIPAGTPEELYTENWKYDAKLDFHGNIISKSDHVTVYGTDIPTSAFGTSEINRYYSKITDEMNPYYYWNCQNCYKVVKSESKPESGFCESNFISGHWTVHSWVRLCKAGSLHTYQCQNCGIQLQTNDVPKMGACRYGANHVWNQLQ